MVVYYKVKCDKHEQYMHENIDNEPYTMNSYIHIKTSHTQYKTDNQNVFNQD